MTRGSARVIEGVFPAGAEDPGLSRILQEVGEKFVPTELNQVKQKLKLRRDLLNSYALWLSKMESGEIAKRKKRLENIAKNAANLKHLLGDDFMRGEIGGKFPLGHSGESEPTFSGLLAGLDHLLKICTEPDQSLPSAAITRVRSPFEYLVGQRLTKVFEKHFHRKAGISRGLNNKRRTEVGRPYMRFVSAALGEFGILKNGKPYRLGAIARAFTDARSGRIDRSAAYGKRPTK